MVLHKHKGVENIDITLLVLNFSSIRADIIMFITAGILTYLVDFKRFKREDLKREARFVKVTSLLYFVGGISILAGFQILDWFT